MQQETVFYDGQCSLCAREINHYRRIDQAGRLCLVDITKDKTQFNELGYEVSTGLKWLHVLDEQGNMQVGVNAFICIWRELPRWKWLARLANLPGIRHILSLVYRLFAAWRFRHNGYCERK